MRRVAVVREQADDLHLRLDLGVGVVDDAERRLALGDEGEGGAHVLGRRQVVLDAVQTPSAVSEAWPYLPAGTSGPAMASRPSPSAAASGMPCAIGRAGSSSRPARSAPGGWSAGRAGWRRRSGLALGQIVHPVAVGRDEDVGRRALLDLPGEGRGGGVGRARRDVGLGGEGGHRRRRSAFFSEAAANTVTGAAAGWAPAGAASSVVAARMASARNARRDQDRRRDMKNPAVSLCNCAA